MAHVLFLGLRRLINLPCRSGIHIWTIAVGNPLRACLQKYNVSVVCFVCLLPFVPVQLCCCLVSGPCRWWHILGQTGASAWTSVATPFNRGLARLFFGFGVLELLCGVLPLRLRQELVIFGA